MPSFRIWSPCPSCILFSQIKYYLDEDHCWAIDVEHLRQQVEEARQHCEPRIMVVVNPGNPTGKAKNKQ